MADLIRNAVLAAIVGLTLVSASPVFAEVVDFAGYLYDEETDASFDVYAVEPELEVTFTYPAAADFHVRVVGETGKELGDFALDDGPVIRLKGGGKFTLIIYSDSGGGVWTAFYERQP